MRAIVIKAFGGLEGLVIEDLPTPTPAPGQALIEVKAFGIDHAETRVRKGEWAEAAKVGGIECVGIVGACLGGAARGIYKAKPARVFYFDEIREAHEVMESNQANGKMVALVQTGVG